MRSTARPMYSINRTASCPDLNDKFKLLSLRKSKEVLEAGAPAEAAEAAAERGSGRARASTSGPEGPGRNTGPQRLKAGSEARPAKVDKSSLSSRTSSELQEVVYSPRKDGGTADGERKDGGAEADDSKLKLAPILARRLDAVSPSSGSFSSRVGQLCAIVCLGHSSHAGRDLAVVTVPTCWLANVTHSALAHPTYCSHNPCACLPACISFSSGHPGHEQQSSTTTQHRKSGGGQHSRAPSRRASNSSLNNPVEYTKVEGVMPALPCLSPAIWSCGLGCGLGCELSCAELWAGLGCELSCGLGCELSCGLGEGLSCGLGCGCGLSCCVVWLPVLQLPSLLKTLEGRRLADSPLVGSANLPQVCDDRPPPPAAVAAPLLEPV